MILDSEKTKNESPEPQAALLKGELPIDLVKRDLRLWLFPLMKGWMFLVGVPLILMIVTLIYLRIFIKPNYESSCALLRTEPQDIRNSGMPEGYSPVQLSVIKNMLFSRANLQQTIKRLNLNITTTQLFSSLELGQPERNGNYLYIIAKTSKPELSAKIANMQAEVFIEDYKKLLRNNLEEILATFERNRNDLSNEIDVLNAKQKALANKFNIFSIDDELSKQSLQITNLENQLLIEATQRNSIQSKITNLKGTLSQTPEEVQVYEEKNTEPQVNYERAVMELSSLRQKYTEENPIIQKQLERVNAMERSLKNTKGSTLQSKVVFGKNMIYTNLKTEVIKMEVEFAGSTAKIKEYTEKLASMRDALRHFNELRPQFRELEDQLDQKKRLLKRLDDRKKSLEMFLERSYSDIAIYEPAVAPSVPTPNKKRIYVLAALVLGLGGSTFGLLLKEALNFKVRSKVDVESALHLNMLGAIPELDPEKRMIFYSSMQHFVVEAEKNLNKPSAPAIVMTATIQTCLIDEKLQEQILEILDVKNIKTVKICSIQEATGKTSAYILNDFLYGLTDTVPVPDEHETLYFMLDDMAFIAPPSVERLQALRKHLGHYDLVLWNLFDYEENAQLFTELCIFADMTIVPMRFNVSDKLKIFTQLKELRAHGIKQMCAVVYDVKNKFYSLMG